MLKDGKGSISRSDSSVGAVKSAVLLHDRITIYLCKHIYLCPTHLFQQTLRGDLEMFIV